MEKPPTLQTHGPTSDGGLEAFLRAAGAVSLYGQIDLIGGDHSGVIAMAAGEVVLEGAQTPEHRALAIRAWQHTFSVIAASRTGAYRCGPLLNHPNADRLTTAPVSELLGDGPARRKTDPAPINPPLPHRVPAQHRPADALEPTATNPLPQRPVDPPRVAPSQFAPEPNLSPTLPTQAPVSQVVTPAPASQAPPPPPPAAAENNPDTRPMRASQLRKILNSADPSSNDETARVLNEPEEATPSRRSALRSIIKNLASN